MVSHLTDTFRDLSNLLTHSQILSVGKNQVEGLIPEYSSANGSFNSWGLKEKVICYQLEFGK